MKKTLLLAAAFALTVSPAMAGTDVTVPLGDWLTGLSGLVTTLAGPLFLAFVAIIGKDLPPAAVNWLKTQQVEQLLEKAIQFGLNKAIQAAPDKVTVPTHSEIIAGAAQYAVDHAPGIVAWAGGAKAIEDKILARLTLTPATGAS